MPVKTYIQAIQEATIEEMQRDPTVFMMGEDLRKSVYGATAGLVEQFGEDRIIDTPLSENASSGLRWEPRYAGCYRLSRRSPASCGSAWTS